MTLIDGQRYRIIRRTPGPYVRADGKGVHSVVFVTVEPA